MNSRRQEDLNRLFHSKFRWFAACLIIALLCSIPACCGEIHEAAEKGNLQKVEAPLKDYPDLVFSRDNRGETRLHRAAAFGKKAVAELLLANKADIHAKDGTGMTPLHYAIECVNKDVAELLLANKADINASDNGGNTPLHRAVVMTYKDFTD
jgi:ankyrin repeat protein